MIIGATAFPVHGYARATLDIDIFIDPTRDNAERTNRALAEFGYDVTDLSIDDLLTTKVLIHGYIVATDVHPFVAGADSFADVWQHRVAGEIEGVPTQFVDLESLIHMKEAAGRPKDLEDLEHLRLLRGPQEQTF